MHLCEEHEDDVSTVGMQSRHHFFVQSHQFRRRGIRSEVGRQQVTQTSVLQDGLQHAFTLCSGVPYEDLGAGKSGYLVIGIYYIDKLVHLDSLLYMQSLFKIKYHKYFMSDCVIT